MGRSITIEDLYSFKFLSRPRIAPDGERVAFVVTTIDEREHKYSSSIWVTAIDGSSARRFTSATARTGEPSWSPDGRWLAFVSDREGEPGDKDRKEQKKHGKGKPQIWLMPTDGGEARQITFMEHGASAPVWSPDSKYLLYTAAVGPSDEETEDGKPLPKVRVIDRFWYRLDGVGYIYERRSHLFLLDIAGGEAQQLTDGDWDDGEVVWSPDGKQIAFTSNRAEDRWRNPGDDIYTLSIADGRAGALRCLTDGTLSCHAPSWSPDGQTIAFLGSAKRRSAGQIYLYTIDQKADKAAATNLSQNFEGTCMDWTNSDIGDDHLMPAPAWSAAGKTLYVLAAHRGASRIYAFSLDGSNGQPTVVTAGDVHVRDFSVDRATNTLALLVGSTTRPQEIFTLSLAQQGEMRRITGFNDELFAELTLSTPEYISYAGADGWPIDGWVIKPYDFDPAKKYPLVVEVHGGPHTQYGYGFFHEMHMLAAEGYVVLYTNPRGSCGYGFEFSDAVTGAWGEKDSLDIMNGVDVLLQKGYIDESRLAVTGGSYGGFMTNWLVGHTDRFKVAITDRCVSNIATMFGVSDIGWNFINDELNCAPWEDLGRYMHMSPISYVQNIHTPLLIIHSEQDLRCNIEQAEQLFCALLWLGREVKFVRFEGQSHGLSRGGHPKLRLERLRHIQDWFRKYLQ
ncbi:S9 family peptidase [Ktedonosporobacter rubrisoli]|uniref:S9 family peptidase n=1 Tax=Ktedonosporobacter rubrisoli TaxID=2509675 RepID=A0A4P6JRX0_KTERU|nr:S9 family peptidase [Ktedonosporobacter rubrisoli]QBD78065.1 S9 family peptidase [Ktedonosporobacter rubrisoli]